MHCDAAFNFREVYNKMQIGLRISIRSTSEIPEGKQKLERDYQALYPPEIYTELEQYSLQGHLRYNVLTLGC